MLFILFLILTALLIWFIFKYNTLNEMIIVYQQQIAQKERELNQKDMQYQQQLQHEIKQAQKRSNNAQRSVIKGQMAEQFVPFMADFPFQSLECQFLGKPIDYLIFHNLSAYQEGLCELQDVKIIFADVKTGQAKLNKRQEIIKQVILNKQIEFYQLRLKPTEYNLEITS